MSAALLDTHLLLWAATGSDRLPSDTAAFLIEPANRPIYSTASLWEVTIKVALDRPDFRIDPRALRRGLRAAGYEELDIRAPHVLAVADLPRHHGDPFDRILLAQARIEALPLRTSDTALLAYGSPATPA